MSAKVCFLVIIVAVIQVQAMHDEFFNAQVDVPVSKLNGGGSLGTATLNKHTTFKEVSNLVKESKDFNPSGKDIYIHLKHVLVNSKPITEQIITFKSGSKDTLEITSKTTMAIDYVEGQ